jgi:hypothetical protein
MLLTFSYLRVSRCGARAAVAGFAVTVAASLAIAVLRLRLREI